jgi:hypothetical protein
MRALPTDTETLLDDLETQYPNRVRKPNESELEHERYAGKVDLIMELRRRLDGAPRTTY